MAQAAVAKSIVLITFTSSNVGMILWKKTRSPRRYVKVVTKTTMCVHLLRITQVMEDVKRKELLPHSNH